MKSYTIKNSDIMHNGKIFPEGSTINLDDKDAESLSDYLVTLSEVEVSSIKSKPELEPKPSVLNSFQDQNNSKNEHKKRSK